MVVNEDIRGAALTAAINEYKLIDVVVNTACNDDAECFRCGKPEEDDEDEDVFCLDDGPDPVDVIAYAWPRGGNNPNARFTGRYFRLCGSCVEKLGHGYYLRQWVAAAWRDQGVIARTIEVREDEEEEAW
jgi:hypothetical protein